MLFTRTLIATSLAALASAQSGTTTISGAQATALVNDIVSYVSGVVADPAFTSNQGVLATAVPSDVIASIKAATDGGDAFLSQLTTATPTWFSSLPTGVVNYYSSIAAAEISIVSKDLKGPAPTVAPAAKLAAGVGAAAGLVALAL